jgi:hypothetical protein
MTPRGKKNGRENKDLQKKRVFETQSYEGGKDGRRCF